MKCSKCGTINEQTAKFCRHCGERIPVGINVMDRYQKLNLVPTNFYHWKKPKVGIFVRCVLRIAMVVLLVQILYCVYSLFIYHSYYDGAEYYYSDPLDMNLYDMMKCITLDCYRECVFVVIIWLVSCLVPTFLTSKIVCNYPKYPKDAKPLSELADYCQKYFYYGIFRRKKTPKFIFFVKDNKFGILDVAHYDVFLPAKYDYLEWREKKKYLNAVIDGRNCIIDINGKELK